MKKNEIYLQLVYDEFWKENVDKSNSSNLVLNIAYIGISFSGSICNCICVVVVVVVQVDAIISRRKKKRGGKKFRARYLDDGRGVGAHVSIGPSKFCLKLETK